jgi:FkbM family methyltransferase
MYMRFDLPQNAYWGDDVAELSFLWKSLRPGMTFVDIGAHHGVFTVAAANRLQGKGRIIAFEPSERERRRLALHIRMNGASCAHAEPYAVTSSSGQASFFEVRASSWSYLTALNSLRRLESRFPAREVRVETISLDEYLKREQIRSIDILKVDVEGGELEVFFGAKDFLSRLRPLVLCEVFDGTTQRWGYPARGIVAGLGEFGYRWFDLLAEGKLCAHETKHDYPEIRNYLAVPAEKVCQLGEMIAY